MKKKAHHLQSFQQSDDCQSSSVRASLAAAVGNMEFNPFVDGTEVRSQIDNLASRRSNIGGAAEKGLGELLSAHNLQMQRTVTVKVETTIMPISQLRVNLP